MGFDAEREFAAVASLGVSPFMLAINPDVPARTLPEFIALAKAQRGKYSFATSASRNLSHITGEMLSGMSGIKLLHVPYKGSPQAAQDTIAGQIHMYVDSIPAMRIARVNRDINATLATPEVAQRMLQFGMFEPGGTPAELEQFMRAERAQWARVIREAGIEPE